MWGGVHRASSALRSAVLVPPKLRDLYQRPSLSIGEQSVIDMYLGQMGAAVWKSERCLGLVWGAPGPFSLADRDQIWRERGADFGFRVGVSGLGF